MEEASGGKNNRRVITYLDGGARELAPVAEQQLDVLSKTAGVVVTNGARVTEGLEDGVGLEDPLLDCAQLVPVTGGVAKDGEVLKNEHETMPKGNGG